MILIFSTFSMNLSINNQNAAILIIIKISRNCHGRFTATYSKFLASHSIHREMWYNFTPTFIKIWNIWALSSKRIVSLFRRHWCQDEWYLGSIMNTICDRAIYKWSKWKIVVVNARIGVREIQLVRPKPTLSDKNCFSTALNQLQGLW